MTTFEINNDIFMVYQIYGVYTGAILTHKGRYTLPFCYVLKEEAEAELIKYYNTLRDNKYVEEFE